MKSMKDQPWPQPNGVAVFEMATRWAVEARRKEEAEGKNEEQAKHSMSKVTVGKVSSKGPGHVGLRERARRAAGKKAARGAAGA